MDKIVQDQAECATLISDTTKALLKKMAQEVAQNTFASQATFYKDAADALRKFKDVIGIKSPKDAEEQEARILNLRRQAQAESDKDKTIVVQFGSAEEYSE